MRELFSFRCYLLDHRGAPTDLSQLNSILCCYERLLRTSLSSRRRLSPSALPLPHPQ